MPDAETEIRCKCQWTMSWVSVLNTVTLIIAYQKWFSPQLLDKKDK